MAKRITLKQLSKSSQSRRNKRSTMRIGGLEISNNPSSTKVVTMRKSLEKAKIIPPISSPEATEIKTMALDSLFGINITIRDDIERNYSLLEEQKKKDLLDNPNIVNPSLKNLNNELQNPQGDKFPNKSDPFFELDDGSPTFRKDQVEVLKKQETKDVSKIAADIFDLNNKRKNPDTKKIKQFSK